MYTHDRPAICVLCCLISVRAVKIAAAFLEATAQVLTKGIIPKYSATEVAFEGKEIQLITVMALAISANIKQPLCRGTHSVGLSEFIKSTRTIKFTFQE